MLLISESSKRRGVIELTVPSKDQSGRGAEEEQVWNFAAGGQKKRVGSPGVGSWGWMQRISISIDGNLHEGHLVWGMRYKEENAEAGRNSRKSKQVAVDLLPTPGMACECSVAETACGAKPGGNTGSCRNHKPGLIGGWGEQYLYREGNSFVLAIAVSYSNCKFNIKLVKKPFDTAGPPSLMK